MLSAGKRICFFGYQTAHEKWKRLINPIYSLIVWNPSWFWPRSFPVFLCSLTQKRRRCAATPSYAPSPPTLAASLILTLSTNFSWRIMINRRRSAKNPWLVNFWEPVKNVGQRQSQKDFFYSHYEYLFMHRSQFDNFYSLICAWSENLADWFS